MANHQQWRGCWGAKVHREPDTFESYLQGQHEICSPTSTACPDWTSELLLPCCGGLKSEKSLWKYKVLTLLCTQFAGATFIVMHVEITTAAIYMRNRCVQICTGLILLAALALTELVIAQHYVLLLAGI